MLRSIAFFVSRNWLQTKAKKISGGSLMGKPEQGTLPISLGIRDLGQRAGKRFMTLIREVIRSSGKQECVAADLGISPEMLSQALNAQRSFRAEWIAPLLRYDHERRLVGYLAWESGCRVSVIEPLTEAEKYKLLVAELRRGGADVESLERRAYTDQEDQP